MALYEVTIRYGVSGVNCASVVHFAAASGAAQLLVEDITGNQGWLYHMSNQLVGTAHIGSVQAKEVGHLILDPDYYAQVVDVPGTQSYQKSDPQLAACISFGTGLSGRKRRGRMFLSGIPDEWVENGKLTSAGQTTLTGFCNAIKARYVTGSPDYGLVVFSRKIYDSLTDIILDSFKPVTTMVPQAVLSTMRTRKPTA
jgi:hypothetical protein